MRLGLTIGMLSEDVAGTVDLVRRADAIGIDSVWTGEAYGSDAVTILAYLAAVTDRIKLGSAILQIPARTPASTAMTAMSLDHLSGGRMLLGLGVSGPQVVEGWHGVPYGRPLARTREYVEVVRRIIARSDPVSFAGSEYAVPYQGPDATGLGKPLKSILHPLRTRIPIYLAALGPRNVRLAAEIADGWLPLLYAPEREGVYDDLLAEGLQAGGREPDSWDVAPTVWVAAGDDVAACRDRLRPRFALYIGGMGSRGRNFYHQLVCRYGYQDAADRIQELYLDGKKDQAAAVVPDDLIDEVALVGPPDRMADTVESWKASRTTTLVLDTRDPAVLERLQAAL